MKSSFKFNLMIPGWLQAVLFLPVFFAVYIFAGILFRLALLRWSKLESYKIFEVINLETALYFLLYKIFILLLITGFVWLFQNFLAQKQFSELGFSKKYFFKYFSWGALTGLLINLTVFIVLTSADMLHINNIAFYFNLIFYNLFITLLVSLIEETSIRGYVLNSLLHSFNKFGALLVSSLLFALLHLANPNMSIISFVNIFLAGCLLGAGYIFTKSLWLPIGLHFSWNFFLGPVLGFEVSGLSFQGIINQSVTGPVWLTGGQFGMEGSLLLTLVIVLAILPIFFAFGDKLTGIFKE